jgi:nicotinate-nucleotide--dimethylbenzimidazole phosphoribosyltransferase
MPIENYSPKLIQFLKAPAKSPNQSFFTRATQHQNQLTKPPGSLGKLETLAAHLASLQENDAPKIEHILIRIFAADHGVVEEGVSAFPQAVTAEMIKNFSTGGAAISVLAKALNADFGVINLGTVSPLPELEKVIDKRIDAGTKNFCQASAMTEGQLEAALLAGRNLILQAKKESTPDIFIGGEMGIGNTTSASALACAVLKQPASTLVGKGTGVDEMGIKRKVNAVEQALSLHSSAVANPLSSLQALGGFEIAGLVGATMACAQEGIPVLVDGFISTIAALITVEINPSIRPWLFFSHRSAEAGHEAVLNYLNADALLNLNMRLGEASGAAVAIPLLKMACDLHNNMATFDQAGVSH